MAQSGGELVGCSVLIVEYDPLVASLFERMLTYLGCRIAGRFPPLTDGPDKLRALRYDAALIEISLNWQLGCKIAAQLIECEIPVVLLSGDDFVDRPAPLDRAPLLVKPFQPVDLMIALIAALGAGRKLYPEAPPHEHRRSQWDQIPETIAASRGLETKPGSTYQLCFRIDGRIVGRDDFVVTDLELAKAIAWTLFDACNDNCTGYELWRDTKLVAALAGHQTAFMQSADAVRERCQGLVVEREEAIRDSRWAIASSKRLLAKLEAMKSVRP
jgi:CheY-like chemotaxis protein